MVLLVSKVCWSEGRDWSQVTSFAYQLQNLNLTEAGSSPFDLLICDYSLHGDEQSRLSAAQVAQLKKAPDGQRRYVLAYLSIGEAEDYRFYWRPEFKPGSPSWLGEPNPQWPDNYPVKYWEPSWRAVVFSYLDKILEAGFDGVYLDRVDAFEMFPNRATARAEMSELVQEIARYSRQRAGQDFGVFPQNGEELLVEPGYLETITGIAREDTYFGYPKDSQASPKQWTSELEGRLRKVVDSGKIVLNVDYSNSPEQAAEARARASENGFLEYVASRELDGLEVALNTPEPAPSGPTPLPWPRILLACLALLSLLALGIWRARR